MARCANCDKIILFGGRRYGSERCCSNRCLLRLLTKAQGQEPDLSAVSEVILELRDDVDALMAEMSQQRAALADVVERMDFLERALVQSRDNAPERKELGD
jgi:hypothetical protein